MFGTSGGAGGAGVFRDVLLLVVGAMNRTNENLKN